MNKITKETIIQRNQEILASDIDGEKVMMSIQKGEYFGLGKIGSFIWDQLANPIEIEDLIMKIMKYYNVDFEKCFDDIVPFLNDLLKKELIYIIK